MFADVWCLDLILLVYAAMPPPPPLDNEGTCPALQCLQRVAPNDAVLHSCCFAANDRSIAIRIYFSSVFCGINSGVATTCKKVQVFFCGGGGITMAEIFEPHDATFACEEQEQYGQKNIQMSKVS